MAEDHAALRAACEGDATGEVGLSAGLNTDLNTDLSMGLCTIVNIEGSFSRRLGAQLAVHPDGSVTGSLSDGCLEQELVAQIARGGGRRVLRYGAGSAQVDFRLPCGGGLDILIDPNPDRAACRQVTAALDAREQGTLALPPESPLAERRYVPQLRLMLFGEGPELEAMSVLAAASGMVVETYDRTGGSLALGQRPDHLTADRWTAIVLLFHDHEWEAAILDWALRSPAFFIGAQGGAPARAQRAARLLAMGYAEPQLARIASPIGTVSHSREPAALALSVLAGVAGEYELRHPHHQMGRG